MYICNTVGKSVLLKCSITKLELELKVLLNKSVITLLSGRALLSAAFIMELKQNVFMYICIYICIPFVIIRSFTYFNIRLILCSNEITTIKPTTICKRSKLTEKHRIQKTN